MSGNVSEWCWDIYYYHFPDLKLSGPESGSSQRVIRGSNCSYSDNFFEISKRSYDYISNHSKNVGFRVARSASLKNSSQLNNVDASRINTNVIAESQNMVSEFVESKSKFEQVADNILGSETINEKDLSAFSKDEIRKLKNTIYAKHGRRFKSVDLQDYFNTKKWYTINENYSDNLLTENDLNNSKIIQKYE